jgi:uncharacterized protein
MPSHVALITGASSGIGLELAKCFARDGHDLLLVAENKKKLKDTAQRLQRIYNVHVTAIDADLSDPASIKRLTSRIKTKGLRVKYLVNDAGIGTYGPFMETPLKKMERMMMLNIIGLTSLTWHLLPTMKRMKEAYILNLGSIASFQPGPLMAVYYATKAYVLSFSEAIRYELQETGISVTCLCPPATDTNFDERAGMQKSKAMAQAKMWTAAEVAQIGYEAMLRKDDIVVPGMMNKLLTMLPRFISARTAATMAKKSLEPAPKPEREAMDREMARA